MLRKRLKARGEILKYELKAVGKLMGEGNMDVEVMNVKHARLVFPSHIHLQRQR